LLRLVTSLFKLDRAGGVEPLRHPLPRLTATDGGQEPGADQAVWMRAANQQRPTPMACRQPPFQPTASDYGWLEMRRRWPTPLKRAMAILDLLQGPGGRTGTFTCAALEQVHTDICLEQGFEPIGWTAVGRELRKALGAPKEYQRINGRQVRVYRIPPGPETPVRVPKYNRLKEAQSRRCER
jgi:hypothetical protein